MNVTIRVYGAEDEFKLASGLKSPIQAAGVGAHFEPGGDTRKPEELEEVAQCDLVLFFVSPDPAKFRADLVFLGKVIVAHGAWTYLPIVVVGEPSSLHMQKLLLRLGASAYVNRISRDGTPVSEALLTQQITKTVFGCLKRSWWHGEELGELPAFIVNKNGLIIRANAAGRVWVSNEKAVGNAYMKLVEQQPSPELPVDHPIQRAVQTRTAVSADRKWLRDGREVRASLLCSPIHIPDDAVHCAAVWLLETTRSAELIKSSNVFSQAKDRKDLYEKIVEQAKAMGFERVRVYELAEQKDRLKGVAAVGFEAAGSNKQFATEFWFDPREDPFSKITFDGAPEYPCRLYVFDPEEQHLDTDLSHYVKDKEELTYYQFLEREGVNRWIEAPIRLPSGKTWGKLSVDNGRKSDFLTTRDAWDLAAFCNVVGNALASMERNEAKEHTLQFVQQASEDLDKHLQSKLHDDGAANEEPNEEAVGDVLSRAIQLTTKLYLQIVGGDMALYRQQDPHHPAGLRHVGPVAYAKDVEAEFRREYEVPKEFALGKDLRGYFSLFTPGSPMLPLVVDDPRAGINRFLADRRENLRAKEVAYLEMIQSEFHVPVFKGRRVEGVVVIVSRKPKAFSDRHVMATQNLMNAVSIWMELAKQQAGRHWAQATLKSLLPHLMNLGQLPLDRDDLFFSGLATLLSAHQALLWNRVFILSCHASHRQHTAELCFALGGLSDNESARTHREKLQDPLFKPDSENVQDLAMLMRSRLKDPAPHLRNEKGEIIQEDALYKWCIEDRRGKDSFRVRYLPPGDPDVRKHLQFDEPVQWLLSWDYSRYRGKPDVPLEIPVDQHTSCGWIRDINRVFQQHNQGCIFDETRRMYAFPLWCTYEEIPEPLGVVLVDMTQAYHQRREDMIEATRAFLALAADILSFRYDRRRLKKYINALPALHHRGDSIVDLFAELTRIRETLIPVPANFANHQAWSTALAANLANLMSKTGADLKSFFDKWSALGKQIERLDHKAPFAPYVKNIGAALGDMQEDYLDPARCPAHVSVLVDDATRAVAEPIPCDPLVFRDLIKAFVSNAKDEAIRLQEQVGPGTILTMELSVRVVETDCLNLPKVVELCYDDDGSGIGEKIQGWILLESFTTSVPSKYKGKGLSQIKSQLNACGANLELNPSPKSKAGQGAHFIVRFGIPRDFTDFIEKTATVSHDEVVNR